MTNEEIKEVWEECRAALPRYLVFAHRIAAMQREEIAAQIKAEDDYCVDNGDYMLDSDDCISIVMGTWVRPDFDIGVER